MWQGRQIMLLSHKEEAFLKGKKVFKINSQKKIPMEIPQKEEIFQKRKIHEVLHLQQKRSLCKRLSKEQKRSKGDQTNPAEVEN